MPYVVLQQVSSPFARANAARTLDKPVGIRFIERHLQPDLISALNEASPDGTIRIWGAKSERSHQFEKMPPRDSMVLFRRGKIVFAHGAIAETTINEPLAQRLWGADPEDGETWPLVFFLKRLVPIRKDVARLNPALGRKPNDNWQGMVSLYMKDTPRVRKYFEDELGAT
jgi:hypothetical protein